MEITSPSNLVAMKTNGNGALVDYLSMQRHRMQQMTKNRLVRIPSEHIDEALQSLSEEEIVIDYHHFQFILELFPTYSYELISDTGTEAMGCVRDAVSLFYLGCTWPKGYDNLYNPQCYKEILQQAILDYHK